MGFSKQEYWSGVPLPSPGSPNRIILFGGLLFESLGAPSPHTFPFQRGPPLSLSPFLWLPALGVAAHARELTPLHQEQP